MMRHPKPIMPRQSDGYTLIEILVVIFIISIVTGIAVLTMSRNENQQVEAVANELTQSMTLAEEQAMLQPMVLGLSLQHHAFQFLRFEAEATQQKNAWQPLQDRLLGRHRLPNNISVTMKLAKPTDQPQIVISTNGDVTPFTLYVGEQGKNPRYEIVGTADGVVKTNRLPT